MRCGPSSTRIAVVGIILLLTVSAAAALSIKRPTVLVTGSTDGIGLTTAKRMAEKGYNVILHGRNAERIERASTLVRKWVADKNVSKGATKDDDDCSSRVFTLMPPADLSTIAGSRNLARDVRTLCQQEPDALRLTVIMNNAGVYAEDRVITADGLELTFAVNVLAPFVITSLLLPTLLQQPKSRIVLASSISQCQSIRNWDDLHYKKQRPYSSHGSYSESKLLDAMLTMEMAERLLQISEHADTKLGTIRTADCSRSITCNCLDPGTVNTKMLLAGWGRCGMDVEDALDETWLCSAEEVEHVTGRYFVNRSDRRASSSAYDPKERAKLWSVLTELAPDAAAMWNFEWQLPLEGE